MKKPVIVRTHDLLGLLHGLYPPALAEEWDNVGLQLGDLAAPLQRASIALDPTAAALAAAEQNGSQVLLTHHPLFFRPVKQLAAHDETGQLAMRAIRAGISVIAAHTNLDRGADGLNDWLAHDLGLRDCQPLQSAAGGLLKLVVFVPTAAADAVAEALFTAGAGHIGGYDRCSFRANGYGSFRPGPGTKPFVGTIGQQETVAEIRLETILPAECAPKILERMRKAHPYEEVAYDLLPLQNRRNDIGLGRIGRLQHPVSLGEFAGRIKEVLGTSQLRMVGDPLRTVAKIAVCGGSGAFLSGDAARQGADLLVTGDVKYHEARQAEARGIALIDAGHFATERLMVHHLASRLRQAAQQRSLALEFIELTTEQDPFTVY